MRAFTTTAVLVLLTVSVRADEPAGKPAPEGEVKKLQGSWRSAAKAVPTVQLDIKGDDVTLNLQAKIKGKEEVLAVEEELLLNLNFGLDVQQAEKKRWLEVDAATARLSGLPRRLYYQLEDDTLTLTLPEGKLKGELKLQRQKDGK